MFVRPPLDFAPDDPPRLSPVVPGRAGRVRYSLDALRERIERQFYDETAHRADILAELDGPEAQRALVREVMDYVLAVEGVRLAPADRAALLDAAHRHLFTFGPLDDLLADETITEVTIDGPDRIHVRRGAGSLVRVPAAFEDGAHLARVLARLLAAAGAALTPDAPLVEVGATLAGRRARIAAVGPPVSAGISATIRLHPREPLPLDALVPPGAADLLRAILAAGHGLLIVGDGGTGKTTLAGALIAALSADARLATVERAAELPLPADAARHVPAPDDPDGLAEAVRAALDESPVWLAIDELRGGDSVAAWEALSHPDAPRALWLLRGDPSPERLRGALLMLLRRANPSVDEAALHRLVADRLPFVAGLRVVEGVPRLTLVAEWALDEADAAAPLTLRPLLAWEDGALASRDRPQRALPLSLDGWD